MTPNDSEAPQNEHTVLNIPNNTRYWFVRAGSKAEYYQDFYLNNYIAIGDNDVLLNELYAIDPLQSVTEKAFKIQYSNLYKETLTDKFISLSSTKELTIDRKKAELLRISRSAGKSATKGFNFIEKMKPGDIILVPSKNSNKFLVGMITSEPFENDISHIILDEENKYNISNFKKKRYVLWLKEISLTELPDKLLWIKNGHQTIFEITKNANDINPILANKYVYKDQYYERIGVSSNAKISENDFYNLQTSVHNVTSPNSKNEIYQTIDIQSPGDQILHTVLDNWKAIAFGFTLLFGYADIPTPAGNLKMQGLVPYFSKKSRLERKIKVKKLEITDNTLSRKSQLDMEMAEEKIKQERIKTKQEALKLETQQRINDVSKEKIKIYKDTEQTNIIPITEEQKETLERIKANQNYVGTVVPFEMQMGTVIVEKDKP